MISVIEWLRDFDLISVYGSCVYNARKGEHVSKSAERVVELRDKGHSVDGLCFNGILIFFAPAIQTAQQFVDEYNRRCGLDADCDTPAIVDEPCQR